MSFDKPLPPDVFGEEPNYIAVRLDIPTARAPLTGLALHTIDRDYPGEWTYITIQELIALLNAPPPKPEEPAPPPPDTPPAEDERRKAEAEAARIAAEASRAAAEAAAKERTLEAKERAADNVFAVAQTKIVEARQAAANAVPSRPSGVSVRQYPKFEVTDIKALYAAHPDYCNIEPNGSVIIGIMRQNPNIKIPGVRTWWEAGASV